MAEGSTEASPPLSSPCGVEFLNVQLPAGGSLRVARFRGLCEGGQDHAWPPVLMLHGAIESGRIFWSRSGKGLAPWLASRGFDVFVPDLRGHGESPPRIDRGARWGQSESISEELPALFDAIAGHSGGQSQHWIAHSWGGVLMSSFLARYPERQARVASLCYFGSKRSVRAWTLERLFKVEMVWGLLCPILIAMLGYLPARRIGIGSSDETAKSFSQCLGWVRNEAWIDSDDGFDYAAGLAARGLPPAWYIAGRSDRALGHPDDVRRLMESSGPGETRYTVLSRRSGNLHDYDHIGMLTHPEAVRDHFPQVEEWLRLHGANHAN
ncbi:MAG: alpha/beta fold hydrolase [Rectinemataceae bacterium]